CRGAFTGSEELVSVWGNGSNCTGMLHVHYFLCFAADLKIDFENSSILTRVRWNIRKNNIWNSLFTSFFFSVVFSSLNWTSTRLCRMNPSQQRISLRTIR